jgi:NAD(P)H-hydrate epimerase
MIPLFAPWQIRAMDERAVARGVPEAALMERAAGHLAASVRRLTQRTYGLRVAILAGRGNNGGDGFALADRLADLGAHPVVCSVHDPGRLTGLPAEMLARWRRRGGPVTTDSERALAGADVAVDCLLGTGATGAPREPEADAVDALTRFEGPVVACDAPTGVDAASGAVADRAVRATRTVTLGAHKVGLWVPPAREHAGEVVLGELDIVDAGDEPVAWVLEPAEATARCPEPEPQGHKKARGVVTIVAGSPGMSGAAALVARGAQAGGAGLVRICTPAAVRDVVAGLVPEALTVALPNHAGEAAAAVEAACADTDALAIGPGLGAAQGARRLVGEVVARIAAPTVVDADGLNALAADPEPLARRAAPSLTLTPHPGELARLVGAATAETGSQRLTLASAHAIEWDAVVVAKGPATVVASPDRRTWITPTGSGELATGGTGDVLTGMVTAALAADGGSESIAAATWVHGRAGEVAARRQHPRTVTATDVVEAVGGALRDPGTSP